MHYCISDLHGEEPRLFMMLDLINFSPERDKLYVLGDTVDRGPSPIECIRLIRKTPGIISLMGNHEEMMLDCYAQDGAKTALLRWLNRGGATTFHALTHCCSSSEREDILNWCAALPDHLDLEVEGRKYHLVHASPGNDRHTRLWERLSKDTIFPAGITICGHTPTSFRFGEAYEGPLKIFKAADAPFYDIDCGCGYLNNPRRRLCCIRLEDHKVFYV